MVTKFIIPVLVLATNVRCTMCQKEPEKASAPASQAAAGQNPTAGSPVTDLKIEVLTTGGGAEAVPGKRVSVHYTGTLMDGTKFDSSLDRGEPFAFILGQRDVIEGWDEGVKGMKVGEKRKLTIPATMAYKERGVPGVIPPNSPLVFEVELLKVE